jgi:hypothetical protein
MKTQKFLAKRFSEALRVMKIQSGHAFLVIKGTKLQVMRYSGVVEPMVIVEY